MGADEVGTLAALKAHRREIVDPAIAAHRGRIVKTTGDGIASSLEVVVHQDRSKVALSHSAIRRCRCPGLGLLRHDKGRDRSPP